MPSLDYDIFTQSGERDWIGNWHNNENDESLIPVDEVLETRLIDEREYSSAHQYLKGSQGDGQ